MDVDARVDYSRLNRFTISAALNGVGGPVRIWRDTTAAEAFALAIERAPVNNPLNAQHRGGVVGTYKAKMDMTLEGSNQTRLRFTITNFSQHARFVENGRSASFKHQFFSWTQHDPPGSPGWQAFTNRLDGQRVIRGSIEDTLAVRTTLA